MSASPYELQRALPILLAARDAVLRDDPDLQQDEARLHDYLSSDPATADGMDIIHEMLRAIVYCEAMQGAVERIAAENELMADRWEKRSKQLRAAVLNALVELGPAGKSVRLPDMTVSVNPGKAGVRVTDERLLPEGFFIEKRVRVPILAAIKAGFERGANVPGAEPTNPAPYLTIRTQPSRPK